MGTGGESGVQLGSLQHATTSRFPSGRGRAKSEGCCQETWTLRLNLNRRGIVYHVLVLMKANIPNFMWPCIMMDTLPVRHNRHKGGIIHFVYQLYTMILTHLKNTADSRAVSTHYVYCCTSLSTCIAAAVALELHIYTHMDEYTHGPVPHKNHTAYSSTHIYTYVRVSHARTHAADAQAMIERRGGEQPRAFRVGSQQCQKCVLCRRPPAAAY